MLSVLMRSRKSGSLYYAPVSAAQIGSEDTYELDCVPNTVLSVGVTKINRA